MSSTARYSSYSCRSGLPQSSLPRCQHAQELDIMLLEERQHTVVEQIGGRDRRLAIVELGKGDLRVGVDESSRCTIITGARPTTV
jgi:hypothetical protein